MASESPVAVIYGYNGTSYIETSTRSGIAVPSGQPGFLFLGSDGTNTRYARMASDGTIRIDPTGTTAQPVTGTFWQATQPVSIAATVAVSGPLTDTQLRASAVPVSLTSTTITGSVAVTGPLTDTQLRATPVPVSGTVTANAGTGTFAISAVSLPLPTGAATEATLATVLTTSAFQARINTLGQKTMANGTPVTIASDQSALPVSQSGTWNISNISGTISLPTGAATETTLASINTKTPAQGQAVMSASSPVVVASDQSPIKVTLTDAASSKLGTEDGVAIPAGTDGLLAMGTDYDDVARRLRTTTDGRLITNSAVTSPPGYTAVAQAYSGDVATETDNFYTIPTGEQLKIQRFAGGGEQATGGSKVEIFYAPNGNNTGTQLIRAGYVSGNNFEFSLDWDAPALGDGTRAILIKRFRFSGGAVELAGFWDGYY